MGPASLARSTRRTEVLWILQYRTYFTHVNIIEGQIYSPEFIGGSFRVTLVAGFGFSPKILRRWWRPTNAVCLSANVYGVVVLLGNGRDTSTLRDRECVPSPGHFFHLPITFIVVFQINAGYVYMLNT